jgi:phosphoribosylaminoimidazole carboxylase PurE protein
MSECVKALAGYGIEFDVKVLSAHRTPEETVRFVREAPGRGVKVFICAAGGAAHLAGAVAAHTTLPVIGVPLASSPLSGFDALLSTVQMPPGVPVATVGVGSMGAQNAAHLAAQILAGGDAAMARKVAERRVKMTEGVLAKGKDLDAKLKELLAR